MTDPDMRGSALRYQDVAVVPVHEPTQKGCTCPAGVACRSAGKHPRVRWPAGERPSRLQVRSWWARWPTANIGIITGEISNMLVLDVDPDHGGTASLAALDRQHGTLPRTLTSRTGSGGLHIVFSHPGVRIGPSAGKLGSGLDIRGDRGLIVAPPSLHTSGRRYEWANPSATPVPPPQWLVNALRPPPPVPRAILRRRLVVLQVVATPELRSRVSSSSCEVHRKVTETTPCTGHPSSLERLSEQACSTPI